MAIYQGNKISSFIIPTRDFLSDLPLTYQAASKYSIFTHKIHDKLYLFLHN